MFLTKAEITQKFNDFLKNNQNEQIKKIFTLHQNNQELLMDVFSGIYDDLLETLNPFKYDPVTPLQFLEDPYYCGKNQLTGIGVAQTMYATLKNDFCVVHDLKSEIRETILKGCVDLDSLIQEADGGLPTLRERIGTDKDVLVLKEKMEVSETVNSRHSGIQKVYKITLENGMSLRLTPDHKVQCFQGKETWIPTKALKIGTFVYVPRIIKTTPSSNIPDYEAKIQAYIMTNGSFDKTRLRYSSANGKTVEDFGECMKKLGFSGTIKVKGNITEWHSTNYTKSGLKQWLLNNCHKYSKGIDIPDNICKSSNEIVAKFINVVIAAEGCVYVPTIDKGAPRIQLMMMSERFIRQFQLLLLRFGIQCRIQHLRQFDKRVSVERFIWYLCISGIDNFNKFLKEIGYVVGKESKCKDLEEYCNSRTSNTNNDILPIKWKSIAKFMLKCGDFPDYKRPYGFRTNAYPSWNTFTQFLSDYSECKSVRILRRNFNEEVGFNRISSISVEDEPIEVGDIGAFNGNRFISNGIGVHNSIGWGKSFFMSLGLIWNAYILSCLKQPQLYFKLSAESKIAIMIISITEKQAKKNMYSNCKEMVKAIPYFQENFMFDPKRAADSLIFPNNIELFSGTSTESSTIGLNIYSAALDEANFFKVIQQSKRARESSGEFDEAMTLYYSILGRQESRFLKQGLKPGVLYLGSSNVYPDDFTEKRSKAASDSGSKSTYVMNYNQWNVCREKYGPEEFTIELGGLNKSNRILRGYEEDVTGEVIKVPMDLKHAFEKDLDNSLRNIAGIALYSVQPFFGDRAKVHDMFDESLPKIFSVELATLSPKREFVMTERILKHEILNKLQTRYIATDIGLKKDLLGFALGHISEIRIVEREICNDLSGEIEIIKEKLPVVTIDMLLSVKKEDEFGEVELQNLIKLVYSLKKYGYKIRYSSADGFQSAHMQQIYKRNGIQNEYISMDKTTEPYEVFRSAVYDGRVKCPYNARLEEELIRLEKDYVNNKVNHTKRSCLVGESEILLENNEMCRIDNPKGLVGKKCVSYNIETQSYESVLIIEWVLTKYTDELIELELENGTILKCTIDHPILLKSGIYKLAGELTLEDELQD